MSNKAFVGTLVGGWIMGVMFMGFASDPAFKVKHNVDNMIRECEAELPRNVYCKLQAVPYDPNE